MVRVVDTIVDIYIISTIFDKNRYIYAANFEIYAIVVLKNLYMLTQNIVEL